MIALPACLCDALRANHVSHLSGGAALDPPPMVKVFNPLGAATWLATELADDGDAMFGLADLGFGRPESGYLSLSEIAALRLPFGIGVERDPSFKTNFRCPFGPKPRAAPVRSSARNGCCAALPAPVRTPIFRRAAVDARAARFAANPEPIPPTSHDEAGPAPQGAWPTRQFQALPRRRSQGAKDMTLVFIDQSKLSVSKTNMRYGKKAPDVSDLLPTVRKRGVIQTLLVRAHPVPSDGAESQGDQFEIVAGARRYHAARIVAAETGEAEPLPCRILSATDDAAAIEASMIENIARLDADEVTQWATFTRLVKEGQTPGDIAATFGLPDLTIARALALGNLLPRIRSLYAAERIDRVTIRHLTLASKSQQRDWLAAFDDPERRAPTGHQLKAWLFGGQSIPARFALFDLDTFDGATIADLFGEDRYFADVAAFWTAQDMAIEARRAAYLEQGWCDVVIVPATDPFQSWDYEKTPKRKGGRVYVDVRSSGEVTFHEGYLSTKDARRAARLDSPDPEKPVRPEVTSTLQAYLDLHRHSAVRAGLLGHPGVALRLMVAHAIAGSHLWRVTPEPQTPPNDQVRESVETSRGETVFDERRRAILGLLGFSPVEPTVIGGNGDGHGVAGLLLRLIDFPDALVLEVVTVVMGETLASGSAAVAAVGMQIGLDMADWWQADDAFFEGLRDREVLTELVAEVAGETIATANATEKTKTLKRIIRDHLDGADGRAKVERWVPRWMAFPASGYTTRGGIGTVAAHAKVEAARLFLLASTGVL